MRNSIYDVLKPIDDCLEDFFSILDEEVRERDAAILVLAAAILKAGDMISDCVDRNGEAVSILANKAESIAESISLGV